jgi:hypothetical protein
MTAECDIVEMHIFHVVGSKINCDNGLILIPCSNSAISYRVKTSVCF